MMRTANIGRILLLCLVGAATIALPATFAGDGDLEPRRPAGKLVRLQGQILDEQCRGPVAESESARCESAEIAPDARLVFLDRGGELYYLENQEAAAEHVGREITVFGLLRGDDRGWILEVTRYIDPEADARAAATAEDAAEGRPAAAPRARKDLRPRSN